MNTNTNTMDELDDYDDHNVLDFGRWLFFCQRCKHGGHASCVSSWFDGSTGQGHGQGQYCQEITTNASANANANANLIKTKTGLKRRSVCGVNGCDCQCSNL